MGIYSSDDIFGIRIYNFDEDENSNILYEQKYDLTMSNEQLREAYLFYNQLNDKNNISFQIYTECSSTLDVNMKNFMMWYPISLNVFLKKFSI